MGETSEAYLIQLPCLKKYLKISIFLSYHHFFCLHFIGGTSKRWSPNKSADRLPYGRNWWHAQGRGFVSLLFCHLAVLQDLLTLLCPKLLGKHRLHFSLATSGTRLPWSLWVIHLVTSVSERQKSNYLRCHHCSPSLGKQLLDRGDLSQKLPVCLCQQPASCCLSQMDSQLVCAWRVATAVWGAGLTVSVEETKVVNENWRTKPWRWSGHISSCILYILRHKKVLRNFPNYLLPVNFWSD